MHPPLIQALLTDPACYDHAVGRLELVETHISWVILSGEFAYKIKKPVDLGFLDFSTLAKRHHDCREELRLNRRLAADYYLAVVGIGGSPEHPRLGGVSQPFEYAVKMRQFPPDATLDRLAARGELGGRQIDALATRLANFHLTTCERAAADSPWGEPAAIARPVEENFQPLRRLDAAACVPLHDWCVAEHARLTPLMAQRKRQGWVRECHGDLHLANLAWVDERLLIFDCLEFAPHLRWIDVISEVAFCYMDLLQRDLAGLAFRFLNTWLEISGDYPGVALLRYYAVYRALVRAKVAALRAEQGCAASRAEMGQYLQLAARLTTHSPLTTPHLPFSMLTLTYGPSGCGKTTLSQRLLELDGLIRLRSDVERKRLAGRHALARGGAEAGLYTPEFGQLTFQHLATLAENLLAAGWPVIVDAAFLGREQRDLFRHLAQRLGVSFRIVALPVDPAVLRERVARRQALGNDASEADLAVLQQQLETMVPPGEDELIQVFDFKDIC